MPNFKTVSKEMPEGSGGWKQWLPVIGLMFSAFIFNTSEFIPIGLLSGIATDFGITESHAACSSQSMPG